MQFEIWIQQYKQAKKQLTHLGKMEAKDVGSGACICLWTFLLLLIEGVKDSHAMKEAYSWLTCQLQQRVLHKLLWFFQVQKNKDMPIWWVQGKSSSTRGKRGCHLPSPTADLPLSDLNWILSSPLGGKYFHFRIFNLPKHSH